MGQKRNFSSVSHRLLTLRPHLYGHHTVVALVSEVKETGRPQALVYSSLFHHDSFPSVHIRKLLELISEFSKVTEYKINTQKSVAFLYTNNENSEREIKESTPSTIVRKRTVQGGI